MSTQHEMTAVHAPCYDDLPEGIIVEAPVAECTVCLLKKQGHIYAFSPTCPHSGARLCEGWTDPAGRIVCPLHKYRFDPANGRNTSGEGYKLITFPTDVREGLIWVQI